MNFIQKRKIIEISDIKKRLSLREIITIHLTFGSAIYKEPDEQFLT